MSPTLAKIVMTKSYVDTLRGFSKGDSRTYLLEGTDYTGFHNARKRLKDKHAWEFKFNPVTYGNKKCLEIKRTQ